MNILIPGRVTADPSLHSTDKILLGFFSTCESYGDFEPKTNEFIADMLGITVRGVRLSLSRLERLGRISRTIKGFNDRTIKIIE